jgi:hypothetical protein
MPRQSAPTGRYKSDCVPSALDPWQTNRRGASHGPGVPRLTVAKTSSTGSVGLPRHVEMDLVREEPERAATVGPRQTATAPLVADGHRVGCYTVAVAGHHRAPRHASRPTPFSRTRTPSQSKTHRALRHRPNAALAARTSAGLLGHNCLPANLTQCKRGSADRANRCGPGCPRGAHMRENDAWIAIPFCKS